MIDRIGHVRTIAGCLFAAGALLAAPAWAQSNTAPQDRWQFDATPYLWFAGLDGDVKIGRLPTGGVEASFSDIASSLHFVAMGAFEGRSGRWGFLADAMYIDLSQSTATPKGLLFGDVEASLKEQLYTGFGSYRVLDGDVAVDVFAGPRYVNVSTDLRLTSGALAGRANSASVSWWDAVGGGRVLWRVHNGWSVMGFLDVGGGGSKLTWEALAGAGYQFNKLVSVKFGYRYLSIDYDTTQLVYDMAMAGPYAGVGFRF